MITDAGITVEELRAKLKNANYEQKQKLEALLHRLIEAYSGELGLIKEMENSVKARQEHVRNLLNLVIKSY